MEKARAKSVEYEYDYTYLDNIMSFLDSDELYPILCGYFNKIV